MPDTYTPPGGYSPANLARLNVNQSLAALPPIPTSAADASTAYGTAAGTANQLAYQTAPITQGARATMQTAAQFPEIRQAAGNIDQSWQLFLKDMELAQQYPRPTPTDNPQGPGFYGGNLMLTPESNAAGFQGFSNPATGFNYYAQSGQNALDTLNSLLKTGAGFNLDQYNTGMGRVSDAISAAIQNEREKAKTALDAYKTIMDQAERDRQYSLEQQKLGLQYGTGGELETQAKDFVDSLSGLTDSKTILAQYNSIKSDKAKTRAVDQELSRRGLNIADVSKFPAINMIMEMNQIKNDWYNLTPIQRVNVYTDPVATSVMSRLMGIKQIYAKTIEEMRVTEDDFKRYEKMLANNAQTPDAGAAAFNGAIKTLATKARVTQELMTKYKNYLTGNYNTTSNNQSDWEEIP